MHQHAIDEETVVSLEDHLDSRNISLEQFRRFETYAAEIFTALGLNINTPATRDTPRRFIEALVESTQGYEGDPKLITVFETECRGGPDCKLGQVIEGPVRFYGLCEHHAMPFYGKAFIGYIPHEHIIGISKLARLVKLYARRFAVQERIGQQIADTMKSALEPHGVAVYLEAHHLCVEMRGVKESAPVTRTTFWRGEYESNPDLRQEFLAACGIK